MNRAIISLIAAFSLTGCLSMWKAPQPQGIKIIPAEEFSRTVREEGLSRYSMYDNTKVYDEAQQPPMPTDTQRAQLARTTTVDGKPELTPAQAEIPGDPRYTKRGLGLRRTLEAPKTTFINGDAAHSALPRATGQHPHLPPIAPGSSAPYYDGQMTSNPSLWPDEGQSASLFSDFRAIKAMDIITILVNENSEGTKKSETETTKEFNLLAGIEEFFGVETSKWAARNTSLDPTQLVKADTSVEFTGEGDIERSGSLQAQMSAVVMEVLPNGLLRVEGTKIISLNSEEEIMVISGLVRREDVNSQNQVPSNRIANMRIDFYGRGIITENQSPGWGGRLFHYIWPF